MFTGQHRNPSTQEVRIFVGGLPQLLDEEELNRFLAQFGSVTDFFIPRDSQTGIYKGYAFVTYSWVRTDRIFGEHPFCGKSVEIKRNLHNNIFLSQVPQNASVQAVKQALEQQGFPINEVLIGNESNGVPSGIVAARLAREDLLQKVSDLESLVIGQTPVGVHTRLPKRKAKKLDQSPTSPNSAQHAHRKKAQASTAASQPHVEDLREGAQANHLSRESEARKLSMTLQNNSKEFHPSTTSRVESRADTGSVSALGSSQGELSRVWMDEAQMVKKLSGGSSSFYTKPEFVQGSSLSALSPLAFVPSTVGVRVAYYTFPGRD